MKKEFSRDEIVWHTNFKVKCVYQYVQNKGRDGRYWHKVQLPCGGFMDTQNIEKYNGQE
jgi:hypothetical protein